MLIALFVSSSWYSASGRGNADLPITAEGSAAPRDAKANNDTKSNNIVTRLEGPMIDGVRASIFVTLAAHDTP